MTKENNIEIYRQRYETFRYLDKLRWQMVQILVAMFSATVLILRLVDGNLQWWFYSVIGGAVLFIAWAMHKITKGIQGNSLVLSKAAQAIGDNGIPDVSKKRNSVYFWITVAVVIGGIVIIIQPIIPFLTSLCCN